MPCRLFAAVIVSMGLLSPAVAQSAPDISGKVVLANLDRYDAYLRVGKTKREIRPKKASVLSPRKYPVTIEFWSGNTKAGWRIQTIEAAGMTFGGVREMMSTRPILVYPGKPTGRTHQSLIVEIPKSGSPALYTTPDSPTRFEYVKFTFDK